MIHNINEKIRNYPRLCCFAFIALLYILPTFIQVAFDKDLHIERFYLGLPGVLSGDEPHYFVTITSILNDHDIFIENNYDQAYFSGGCDVGFHFINNTHPKIARHMFLFNPEHKILTIINNENSYNATTYNEELQKLYTIYNITTLYQVPSRPLGLPVVSAIFLWPFANTCMLEHAAIYLTVLISLIGIFFFYCIASYYTKTYAPENYAAQTTLPILFTILFALCTQQWHYAKTYFVEPYLATFLLGAYYFFFIKKQSILPGFLLALGFSMKYPFGMFLPFFGVFLLYQKAWKRISWFILGAAIPFIATFYYNWYLTGSLLLARSEYLRFFDNYIAGAFASLFHPIFGIIPFAPFLLFSFLGIAVLWKKDRKTAFTLSLLIFPYFLFWSSLALTPVDGGGAYSGRYPLPLLGFFVLLCLIWYIHNKSTLLQKLFFCAIALSFFINAQAAFLYPLFWNNPPWILFTKIMLKGDRVIQLLSTFFGGL